MPFRRTPSTLDFNTRAGWKTAETDPRAGSENQSLALSASAAPQIRRKHTLDPSLTSGSTIAIIGISTVFVALMTLIGLVTVMGRVFSPPPVEPAEGHAPVGAPGSAQARSVGPAETPKAEPAGTAATDFHQIALSAYAYHRRATTRVKSDEPSTPWLAAGRIHEINLRRGSN